MPNVAHLMKVPLDSPDLNIPDIPSGTWKGELVKITYRDEEEKGVPLTDKNGDEYAQVRLLCRPEAPTEDVNKKDADAFVKAGGLEETVLSQMLFARGKKDFSKIGQQLKALGVPIAGRSMAAVSTEYKGGVPVFFEVEHGKNPKTGDPVINIAAIYSAA